MGLLNSVIADQFMKILSPTLDFNSGTIAKIPYIQTDSKNDIINNVKEKKDIAKNNWDSYETSWDFEIIPMLKDKIKADTIEISFDNWLSYCSIQIRRLQHLEKTNNIYFLDAYGLTGEFPPDVTEENITFINASISEDIKNLLSYSVGCMMGRYSLNNPGLIYAHDGNVDFNESNFI